MFVISPWKSIMCSPNSIGFIVTKPRPMRSPFLFTYFDRTTCNLHLDFVQIDVIIEPVMVIIACTYSLQFTLAA